MINLSIAPPRGPIPSTPKVMNFTTVVLGSSTHFASLMSGSKEVFVRYKTFSIHDQMEPEP